MRKVLSVILVYFISYVKTLVYEFNNLLLVVTPRPYVKAIEICGMTTSGKAKYG